MRPFYTRSAASVRFPPFADGRVGHGVPETGHSNRHLEADATACDPRRSWGAARGRDVCVVRSRLFADGRQPSGFPGTDIASDPSLPPTGPGAPKGRTRRLMARSVRAEPSLLRSL